MTADVLLHTIDAGIGEKTVLLLHGMMGSAESWWQLIPRLVQCGHRVIALDLPGHGLSLRDPELTVESAAASVVETVGSLGVRTPLVAMGHSYGGVILAAAASRLPLALTVYVDTPFAIRGGHDRDDLSEKYEQERRARTPELLARSHPFYGTEDIAVEGRAARRFDPITSASVSSGSSGSWPPSADSIVVRASPSTYVTDEDAAALRTRGIDVRSIEGAAHSIWYSHLEEFLAALPELFAAGDAAT